ncbi:hypothetical protein GCM10010176_065160 [Nonomuraea spiralis]|nr:hypothetical protein GCM10010176_065160 [Nonomuraea spiralis]
MCTSASTACMGHLFRRLEQWADFEAEVGEGGGDDLLAAVVAVLARLRAARRGSPPRPDPSASLAGLYAWPGCRASRTQRPGRGSTPAPVPYSQADAKIDRERAGDPAAQAYHRFFAVWRGRSVPRKDWTDN